MIHFHILNFNKFFLNDQFYFKVLFINFLFHFMISKIHINFLNLTNFHNLNHCFNLLLNLCNLKNFKMIFKQRISINFDNLLNFIYHFIILFINIYFSFQFHLLEFFACVNINQNKYQTIFIMNSIHLINYFMSKVCFKNFTKYYLVFKSII